MNNKLLAEVYSRYENTILKKEEILKSILSTKQIYPTAIIPFYSSIGRVGFIQDFSDQPDLDIHKIFVSEIHEASERGLRVLCTEIKENPDIQVEVSPKGENVIIFYNPTKYTPKIRIEFLLSNKDFDPKYCFSDALLDLYTKYCQGIMNRYKKAINKKLDDKMFRYTRSHVLVFPDSESTGVDKTNIVYLKENPIKNPDMQYDIFKLPTGKYSISVYSYLSFLYKLSPEDYRFYTYTGIVPKPFILKNKEGLVHVSVMYSNCNIPFYTVCVEYSTDTPMGVGNYEKISCEDILNIAIICNHIQKEKGFSTEEFMLFLLKMLQNTEDEFIKVQFPLNKMNIIYELDIEDVISYLRCKLDQKTYEKLKQHSFVLWSDTDLSKLNVRHKIEIHGHKCSNKNCKNYTQYYSNKLDQYVCSQKCLEEVEQEIENNKSITKW